MNGPLTGELRLPHTTRPVSGRIVLPGSKSVTHRAYIAAALARGKSRITGDLLCDDTLVTRRALESLGAVFQQVPGGVDILGFGQRPRATREMINLGQSGTSLRLLISLALLVPGTVRFSGDSRLLERPLEPLLQALRSLGAQIVCRTSGESIEVCGGMLRGGRIEIPGNISSQFVSSLLIIAPLLENGLVVDIVPPVVSRPYIDLTVDVLRHFGILVEETAQGYCVAGGQEYRPRDFHVEPDLSSASYFWAAAALSGGKITTVGIPRVTCQGELAFLDLLGNMNSTITRTDSAVTVEGGTLRGVEADLRHIPDQVPTLAVLGAMAEGRTVITGVCHLRYKESDRLACLREELAKLGVCISETDDGLEISKGETPAGEVLLDSHDDHRLAMSFALLGLRYPGIRLRNPECVSKSFPEFWKTWAELTATESWGTPSGSV